LDEQRTTILRHQTQTRFCHFLGVALFFVILGLELCGCQLPKWLLLATQAH